MSREEGPKPSVTVTVVAGGGMPVRTIRIPYPGPGGVGIFGGLLILTLLILSWGYFAVRASRVAGLEEEIAEFQGQEERIEALAQSLVEVELAYARIRSLFGSDALQAAEDLWLPPATGRTSRSQQPAESDLPTAWPLSQGGYVTQDQLPSTGGGGTRGSILPPHRAPTYARPPLVWWPRLGKTRSMGTSWSSTTEQGIGPAMPMRPCSSPLRVRRCVETR